MLADIACILFACTAVNHLGLISAIERVIKRPIPIVNCSKCLTFWATALWCYGKMSITAMLAISLLNAYLAVWLELIMGSIDTLYYKLYETVYPNAKDNEVAATTDNGDSSDGVSELQ